MLTRSFSHCPSGWCRVTAASPPRLTLHRWVDQRSPEGVSRGHLLPSGRHSGPSPPHRTAEVSATAIRSPLTLPCSAALRGSTPWTTFPRVPCTPASCRCSQWEGGREAGAGGGGGGEKRVGLLPVPPALSGVSRAGGVSSVVPAPESTLSSSVPPALGEQRFLAASNLGCFTAPIRVSATPSLH